MKRYICLPYVWPCRVCRKSLPFQQPWICLATNFSPSYKVMALWWHAIAKFSLSSQASLEQYLWIWLYCEVLDNDHEYYERRKAGYRHRRINNVAVSFIHQLKSHIDWSVGWRKNYLHFSVPSLASTSTSKCPEVSQGLKFRDHPEGSNF